MDGTGAAAIRDATSADLDLLHAINEANTPSVGSVSRDQLAALVATAAFSLVITTDDTAAPAGFCVVLGPGADYGSVNYRWFMDRYTDAMYLDRVAFAQAAQGRGLGTALYGAVFHRLAADHADKRRLTLEVNIDPPNEGSLRFHRRLGFTEVGQQDTPYGIRVSMMERLTGGPG